MKWFHYLKSDKSERGSNGPLEAETEAEAIAELIRKAKTFSHWGGHVVNDQRKGVSLVYVDGKEYHRSRF